MTDLRTFIRNMGKDAPAFFDVSPDTINRWLKTGSVPIKKAEKILAAINALEKSQKPEPVPATQQPGPQLSPGEDPYTHLPKDINRRLPEIQVTAAGRLPETIEINPTEQSFGNNFTRPGRVTYAPMPPMKLRDEGGQKVAYVDTTPKTPTVLPPSIANDNWTAKSEPLPAQRKTEGVPAK
jgi:hypothetical protein